MVGEILPLHSSCRSPVISHRIIAAAADCTEATLNRILKGRVQTCKLNTLEFIAAALGYEVKLVKKAD